MIYKVNKINKAHEMSNKRRILLNTIDILVGLGAFALGLWFVLNLVTGSVGAAEYVQVESGTWLEVPVIDPEETYYDSRRAEAKGSELIEGIRLMMLECGSYTVSEADKREHCAVLFKQLYYTQTVGGYNGWGTTLWGVMHAGNTYLQTAPRIWTADGDPTDEIAAIFWDVWINGYSTDFRVQNYRTLYYFTGDWAIPAYQIGTTYYSINVWQDFSMFDIYEVPIWKGSTVIEEPVKIAEIEETEEDWFEEEEKEIKVIVRFYER